MKKLNFKLIFILILSFFVIAYCSGSKTSEDGAQDISDDSSKNDRQIVEPDIYRIDGDTLYIANLYRGLVAVDISQKDTPELLGSMQLKGLPKEMYFQDNVTVMLLNPSYYYNHYYQHYYGIDTNDHSIVSFIDTVDKSEMEFITEFLIPGYMVDSRVVGDVLYVVTNVYNYSGNNNYYSSYYSNLQRTNYITSINLNTYEKISTITIEGSSSAIHVTKEAVFVVSMDNDYWNKNKSTITRYDISDPNGNITLNSTIEVTGIVPDRFKLNYYNKYLRVVSYDWHDLTTKVHSIYWGDKKEPVLENTLDLAIGESLFATRFSGNIGYVVTFLRKDPLFIIDFSEPSKPVIAAAMDDIPGWSDHIEVLGDRLFALGQENGRVKVAYFDVSDPYNPVLLQTIFLGNTSYYSYSMASWDYKRLNYLPAFKAYAVPVNTYESGYYKSYVELIKINRDTIESFAVLVHQGNVKRTIQISDEIVYTYSDDKINSHHIDAEGKVQPKSRLILAENVFYVMGLNNDIGIKFVNNYFYGYSNYYSQTPLIKTFKNSLNTKNEDYIGEIILDIGSNKYIHYNEHIIINDILYILMSSGGPSYGYADPSLLAIDFKDPSNPKLLGKYDLTGISEYVYNPLYNNSYRNRSNESVFHQFDQNTLALAIDSTLIMLDLSRNGVPAILSTTNMKDKKHDIQRAFYHDDKAYLLTGKNNFYHRFNKYEYDYLAEVIDISDPQNPEYMYTKELSGLPIAFLEDNYIVSLDKYQTLFGGNSFNLVVEEITNEKVNTVYRRNFASDYLNYYCYDDNYMLMVVSEYSNNKYITSLIYSYIDSKGEFKEETILSMSDNEYIIKTILHNDKILVITNIYNIIVLEKIEGGTYIQSDIVSMSVTYSYGVEIIGDILYQWAGMFGISKTELD